MADGSEHYIETSIKVYLEWVDGSWEVAGAAVDGYALDERDSGPSAVCQHETAEQRAECRRVLTTAARADMPTADELVEMLQRTGVV